MMRTLSLLACVVLVPIAAAQGVDVEGAVSLSDAADVNVDGVPTLDRTEFALQGLVPTQGGKSAPDGRIEEREPETAASKHATFAGLDPDAQKAAAVAGAGASLTLLIGLVAHALGVPLFSRIQSSRLLDNGVRQRVHETIIANPGITIKEVVGVCGIGWGTAVYHLKRLESERLVVSERNRQFRRYYKNGGGIVNESKAAYGELKHPTTERLAQSILESPGRCQKELCESVGISAPLAHKFLSRLTEAGLVSTQREWKTVKYFPTPKLEDLLQVGRPVTESVLPTPLAAAA